MAGQRVAGIVAEFNPFHNGHRHLIKTLRGHGYDTVVCVMSGALVQRAEPSFMAPHHRAKAALDGGADLVFRLPAPWSCATAETFARGGVELLAATGCVDTVAFGAETPDAEAFFAVADALATPAFSAALQKELQTGVSFAAARATAAERVCSGAGALLASPNNILAVEYVKALRALEQDGAPPMQPLPIQRVGAGHTGSHEGRFASAAYLRARLAAPHSGAVHRYLPTAVVPHVEHAVRQRRTADADRWSLAMLSRLRGKTAAHFLPYTGRSDGLAFRMQAATETALTLTELHDTAKTKRFAHARVRRTALWAALQLPPRPPQRPPFLHLLAASPRGLRLLGTMKQTAALPFSPSLATLEKHSQSCRQYAKLEADCQDLTALCQKQPQRCGLAYTVPLYKGQ